MYKWWWPANGRWQAPKSTLYRAWKSRRKWKLSSEHKYFRGPLSNLTGGSHCARRAIKLGSHSPSLTFIHRRTNCIYPPTDSKISSALRCPLLWFICRCGGINEEHEQKNHRARSSKKPKNRRNCVHYGSLNFRRKVLSVGIPIIGSRKK